MRILTPEEISKILIELNKDRGRLEWIMKNIPFLTTNIEILESREDIDLAMLPATYTPLSSEEVAYHESLENWNRTDRETL